MCMSTLTCYSGSFNFAETKMCNKLIQTYTSKSNFKQNIQECILRHESARVDVYMLVYTGHGYLMLHAPN